MRMQRRAPGKSSDKGEATPAPMKRGLLRRRIIILFCSLAAALTIISGQLFSLQVFRYSELVKVADGQVSKRVPSVSRRGTIYDRNGRELAISLATSSIFARPSKVENPERASAALSAALGLPAEKILERLRAGKSFVYLKRSASAEEAEAVERLMLKGIGSDVHGKRFYPKSQQAAHLLGFVGTDDQGLEGLELQYDIYLAGKRKWIMRQQDAKRRPIFREEAGEAQGSDLHLTIDEVIQYITERELEAAVSQSVALSGSAIVMDPFSGEILALANYPTFDPNVYAEASAFARRNRAVADYYEPGSAFKAIVGAGALEERLVRPEDRFNAEGGAIEVGGVTIRDHERFETLTFAEVMAHSSNVGAIRVGQRLGKSHYYDYISGFGFGNLTKIDLPGETPGLIRRPKEWSALSLASLSIGQEISVSPLQMLTAMSAIANGGNLIRPYVAKSIVAADGQVVLENAPMQVRRVISEDTARTLATILKGVVTEGTGKAAAVEGFEVAGKTGTSQKVDRATGRYSRHKVVASFVGFVPVERPRLAIIVIIDEPTTLRWGGSIAAPTFREIARESLKHLRKTPVDRAPFRLAEGIRNAAFRLN
ncbi:MAG: penicillin-binding protein 2 [Candidatus Methylomirabilis oxygeniifera]|uniref:Division-specific transpeptidase, penicillin-binding protein n=1 Tax=Methylomirabilis oxygeniifera TaxID=671143 RepID=D5MI62_METO1|nr:MAG: penicillin-binding protein 2 [Candidatus Methylomirabilis oxyfera]CBE69355.1 division-specific transpeptidase, penicillin-binding protein [Candidatus Methylomirabilis oxyfera]